MKKLGRSRIFCLLGLLVMGLSAVLSCVVSQPAQAYYKEDPTPYQENGQTKTGFHVFSIPVYQVKKHYYIDNNNIVADEFKSKNNLTEYDLEGYETYLAVPSLMKGLHLWVDEGRQVRYNTPASFPQIAVNNVNRKLQTPKIQDSKIYTTRTIDCGMKCMDHTLWNHTEWGFDNSYNKDCNPAKNIMNCPIGNGHDVKDFSSALWKDVDDYMQAKKGEGSLSTEADWQSAAKNSNGTEAFKNAMRNADQEGANNSYIIRVDWEYTMVDLFNNDPQNEEPPQPQAGGNGGSGTTKKEDETCEGNAGTALGWILCPLTEGAGKFAQTVYHDMVEPMLNIDSKLLSETVNNQENGTFKGWTIFRNMANIVFVILMLVVIFSQLTGVGVSNYGIKKILPKLIIVAVLVNLSFILCQICVDISNILGKALESLFNGFADKIGQEVKFTTDGEDTVFTFSNIATNLVAGIIVGTLVYKLGKLIKNRKKSVPGSPTGVFSQTASSILVMLLMVFVVVGLGILAFFCILSIRQALVVILTVISPLACVCLLLPGTKSLFDKWRKLFTSMLLLYPICGLLVGASNFVGRLLLGTGTNNWWIVVTAMILPIASVVCIPFVLKSTMQALGTLGGKLNSLTSIGSKAGAKIRGTNRYKNIQQRGKIARAAHRTRPGSLRSKLAGTGLGRVIGTADYVNDAQNAAAKQHKDDIDAIGNTIQAETGGDTAKMLDQYDSIIKKDGKLSQQDSNRLEYLQSTLLQTPGYAKAMGERLSGETKDKDGNTLNKHIGETATLLQQDAKGAGTLRGKNAYQQEYAKEAAQAHADGRQMLNYNKWLEKNSKRVTGSLTDKDIIGMNDKGLEVALRHLDDSRLDHLYQTKELDSAEFSDAKKAIEAEYDRRTKPSQNQHGPGGDAGMIPHHE